ncbi:porin family protein [Paraglaciecola aestuariivivens]
MKHKLNLYSTLAALTALSSFSVFGQSNNANEYNPNGFYIGANYGYLQVDSDDNFDEDKDVVEGIAGYRFNQFFALEGSYLDFGSYGNNNINLSTEGYTAALKGSLPVTDSFSVFMKLGQLWSETDYQALNFSEQVDDQSVFVGGGLAFKLSSAVILNATYSVYDAGMEFEDIDDQNFDTDFKQASVGIEYRF